MILFACQSIALVANAAAVPPASLQVGENARNQQLDAASAARTSGDFERARRILSNLLEASPKDPDFLRRLAMVEASDKRLDEALRLVDEAQRLAPDDLDVALSRAYILYWRGDIAEARTQVAAIESRRPDYPELAALKASIGREKSDGIGLRAMSVAVGLSDIALKNGASQTWTNQTLVTALDFSRHDIVTLSVGREKRSAGDTRLFARWDRLLARGSFYIAATAVPNPDFQERWSASSGGELIVSKKITVLLDLRAAKYDTGTIFAVQPGARIDLGSDFALTGRAINIFGDDEGYRIGSSVRLDYRREYASSFFATAASYPDAEAGNVRQMRSVAGGGTLALSDAAYLTAAASYENRSNSYRRWTGTLAISYRFNN